MNIKIAQTLLCFSLFCLTLSAATISSHHKFEPKKYDDLSDSSVPKSTAKVIRNSKDLQKTVAAAAIIKSTENVVYDKEFLMNIVQKLRNYVKKV